MIELSDLSADHAELVRDAVLSELHGASSSLHESIDSPGHTDLGAVCGALVRVERARGLVDQIGWDAELSADGGYCIAVDPDWLHVELLSRVEEGADSLVHEARDATGVPFKAPPGSARDGEDPPDPAVALVRVRELHLKISQLLHLLALVDEQAAVSLPAEGVVT